MVSQSSCSRSVRRMPGRALMALATLSALCACPAPSRAQVVYDNFAPPPFMYDPFTGIVIAGPDTFWEQSSGALFTPSGSGSLASIEVAMTLFDGPNHFDLFLYADNAGAIGPLLESWSVDGAMSPYGTLFPPIFIASSLAPQINTGSSYWLVGDTTLNTDATWMWNWTGDAGPTRWGPSGGPLDNEYYDVFGAFRVTVNPTAVPEPSSIALLLGGGAGCFVMLRRRRR